MKIIITGFPEGKKIQAIKGIRAATGLDLKGAKHAADDVEANGHVEISVPDKDALAMLGEAGVTYRQPDISPVWNEYVEVLGRFPQDMAIGTLLAILSPVADLA